MVLQHTQSVLPDPDWTLMQLRMVPTRRLAPRSSSQEVSKGYMSRACQGAGLRTGRS